MKKLAVFIVASLWGIGASPQERAADAEELKIAFVYDSKIIFRINNAQVQPRNIAIIAMLPRLMR